MPLSFLVSQGNRCEASVVCNMSKAVEGNLCLFLLLRVSAILVFITGLAVLGDGVYATIESKSFNYYSGGVLIFGVVIVLLATLGYLNRSNPYLLLLYLVVLFLVLLALGALTLVMVLDPDLEDRVGGLEKANYLRYSLLCGTVVSLVAVLLACCYRSSLLSSYLKNKYRTDPQKAFEPSAPLMQPTHYEDFKKRPLGGPLEDLGPETQQPASSKGKVAKVEEDKKIKPVQPAQKPGKPNQPFALKS